MNSTNMENIKPASEIEDTKMGETDQASKSKEVGNTKTDNKTQSPQDNKTPSNSKENSRGWKGLAGGVSLQFCVPGTSTDIMPRKTLVAKRRSVGISS